MRAVVGSLRQVFPYAYVLSVGEAWQAPGASTFVLLASRKPLDAARFQRIAQAGAPPESSVLPEEQFAAYLGSGPAVVLTDDYAPVDQLVARLFVDRGF